MPTLDDDDFLAECNCSCCDTTAHFKEPYCNCLKLNVTFWCYCLHCKVMRDMADPTYD